MPRANKTAEDYHEGSEAADRFDSTINRLLKVSKEELAKREAAYQQSRARKDRPAEKDRK